MTTSTYDLPAAVANVPLTQDKFVDTLYGLADGELHSPSVLPGWTRAHVIAHVARNGEGIARLIDGVLMQQQAEMYPGGPVAREQNIDATANQSLSELIDDVTATNSAVVHSFARMTAPTWGRSVAFPTGVFPASRCAWSRWRELEIHHVDLGLDVYTIESWPEEFLSTHLPHELAKLPSRLPPDQAIVVGGSRFGIGDVIARIDGPEPALFAWLVGRVGLAAPYLTSSTGALPELPRWD